jgi:predicted NAD/FAD-dependent oxidoreductase
MTERDRAEPSVTQRDVIIVGAGLAGLTAAGRLSDAGRSVTVIDKGRSVGGRLATRRIGDVRFDHGAQFFTQRGPELAALVTELQAAGVVREWCRGFGQRDEHPRYLVEGGMNALAKHLAADLDDVRTGVQATSVERVNGGWRVAAGSTSFEAPGVLLTAPVPQSLELVAAGGAELDPGIGAALERITYDPAIAVMALLDGPSAVPPPGALQFADGDGGPFSFIADNATKQTAETSALTLHTSPAFSTAHWDDDDDDLLAELLDAAAPWIGGAGVVEAQLKRWRYAAPRTTWPERSCVAVDGDEPLVLAGDAFDGPRVEGAYVSGLSGATAVLRARTLGG